MPVKTGVPVWAERRIGVQTTVDGKERITYVNSECLGTLAIHPSTVEEGRFNITHIPTGLKILEMPDREVLKKIVLILRQRCPDLSYLTREDVLLRMPQKWIDWLKSCQRFKGIVKEPT